MELWAKPREAVGTMAGEPWYNPMGFRCVVPRLPDDAAPDRNRTHGAPLRLTCAVETGMGCRGGGRYPKFKELPKERMSTEPVKAMTKEETRAWAAKQFPIEGAWLKDGKGAVEGFPRWHLASAYYPKIGPNGSPAGNVRHPRRQTHPPFPDRPMAMCGGARPCGAAWGLGGRVRLRWVHDAGCAVSSAPGRTPRPGGQRCTRRRSRMLRQRVLDAECDAGDVERDRCLQQCRAYRRNPHGPQNPKERSRALSRAHGRGHAMRSDAGDATVGTVVCAMRFGAVGARSRAAHGFFRARGGAGSHTEGRGGNRAFVSM